MSQTSSFTNAVYEYNPQNRMVRSRVVDDEARTMASTRYGYDPLGRRALVQDNGTTTLRTLYDGLGFDVVKESPVYANGGFVDTYNTTYEVILLMTLHHFGKELQEHILAMLMESEKCYLNLFFLWFSYFLLLSSQ